jgi:hypothetical protein
LEHFCIEKTMTWGIPHFVLILSAPETPPAISEFPHGQILEDQSAFQLSDRLGPGSEVSDVMT